MDRVKGRIRELVEVLEALDPGTIAEAMELVRETLRSGGKILACGNGGSAAQAQHFVAELVVRYRRNRRALPAVALTTDTSVLTACANDFGYERVFERGVEALGEPGDLLLAISTSGRSENVNRAVRRAREMGLRVLYLCGEREPDAPGDLVIKVPSGNTPRVQEAHELILHLLAEAGEEVA